MTNPFVLLVGCMKTIFFVMPIKMNDGIMFYYTCSITVKNLATFISHINMDCFNSGLSDIRNKISVDFTGSRSK